MDANEIENAHEQEAVPKLKLKLLDRFNWETVAKLQVETDQQKYIPDNLYSIAQSKFEPCEPFGIFYENRAIGFILICRWSGVYWITRIMIDANEQGNGYGTKALQLAIQYIRSRPDATEIRTTIARGNALAEYVFTREGFERSYMMSEREAVYRLEL